MSLHTFISSSNPLVRHVLAPLMLLMIPANLNQYTMKLKSGSTNIYQNKRNHNITERISDKRQTNQRKIPNHTRECKGMIVNQNTRHKIRQKRMHSAFTVRKHVYHFDFTTLPALPLYVQTDMLSIGSTKNKAVSHISIFFLSR